MNSLKKLKKVYIFLFIICITVPNILLLLGVEFYSDENRTLSTKPEFSIYNIANYPTEYTNYYEDNMPFKDFFVKFNAFIQVNLFNVSSEKAVILGKDGWLFYNSQYKESTNTLEDYINSESISLNELEACKNTLIAMEQVCEREGATFIFMITPNKMSIYGDQFMPDIYKKQNEVTKSDILVKYLRENTDINIVYPKEELIQYMDKINLYCKLDTHWNELGSYIGYRNLYETMFGIKLPSVEDIDYTVYETKSGDLAAMLKYNKMNDTRYNVEYKEDIIVEREGEHNDFYATSDSGQKSRLLMFRDSFSTAMEKYITKDIAEAHLIWTGIFDEGLVIAEQPNIVVYQVAERFVSGIPDTNHIFTTMLSETDEYDKESLLLHVSENIIGYCIPEQTGAELRINGFCFLTDKDSEQTEASVILAGNEILYEAPIKLNNRYGVEEVYSDYEKIGNSGIDINLYLGDIQLGSYDVYIVLKNAEQYYTYNMAYMFEKK